MRRAIGLALAIVGIILIAMAIDSTGQVVQPGSGTGAVSSVTNSDGTLTVNPTTGAIVASINLANANTWSAEQTFSDSPTGSSPGTLFSGTPTASSLYFPVVAIDTTGATAPSRSTSGTMLEVNAPSGFGGNLLWGGVNGTQEFNITASGAAFVASVATSTGSLSTGLNINISTSTGILKFNNGATYDTGIDRKSAGLLEIDNSATGSSGALLAAAYESGGTKFTTSGCSVSSTTGGGTAGKMTLGANTCSVIITMNGATGFTATNGWACSRNDETTAAGNTGLYQSGSNTTTATIVVPATAGITDVIDFSCTAY